MCILINDVEINQPFKFVCLDLSVNMILFVHAWNVPYSLKGGYATKMVVPVRDQSQFEVLMNLDTYRIK